MSDVSGLFDSLPKDEKIIMQRLRSMILEAAPAIQEKISYGVPYFYHHRRVCFLWPASLIPANMERPTDVKVTIGLCYGNELSNAQGLLQAGKRKQVYVIPVHSLNNIQERLITEIILEAVMVDDEFGKQKREINMAEPLKYMYNPAFFEKLCPVMKQTIPGFDCHGFVIRVFNNQWPDLELKQRVRHIAQVLHQFLPNEFPMAATMLVKLSKRLMTDDFGLQGFQMMFIPDYVEMYGQDHPDIALPVLEHITELVSAEFAIRPFLQKYPGQTMKKMLEWSTHKSANVRRLASEGCRPRLPWAMGAPALKKDPSPILPILENLKGDGSEYVRRSVANNLNDIAKDHPALVLKIARRWRGKNADTNWIIKHGCRGLLKKGNAGALNLHGFDPDSKSTIRSLNIPNKKVKVGDYLNFEFDFINKEKRPKTFRLEYAIDYKTSTGKTSRKIFKITENDFKPGEPVSISRKQSFRDFTTRKHFKGMHQLTILANGKKLASQEFKVC